MHVLPKKRLLSVAQEVRQDAIVADIGTDHAYLPIFLLESGRVRFAYLTDINSGPLDRARRNAAEAGLSERVECILTDGISALSGLPITDFCICGMGGELIADILSKAPFAKNGELKFILQPMSREGTLRSFLYSEGFAIEREIYSFDAGKHYVAFSVKYTGERKSISALEAECGVRGVEAKNSDCQVGYIKKKIKSYEKIVRGKRLAGADTAEEESILAELSERLYLIGG
jgi:tRNA (adenine22-N1)-methyltransferase